MHEAKESIVEIKKNKLKQQLLKELYLNGSNTIIDLSKTLHSSPPSVNILFIELMQEGWLTEVGTGNSKSGRKPVLYGLNANHGYILTWLINKFESTIVIYNLKNEICAKKKFKLQIENNAAYGTFILENSIEFLKKEGILNEKILGIGICMPGLIDKETWNNFSYPTNEGKAINILMSEFFNVPSYTLNDAKAIALGEKRFGLAHDFNNVLAINIDWGVGLGILINGEVFNGTSGFTGELGHIQVRGAGELCSCGKIGCLETVATAQVLIKRVKEELQKGRVSKIVQLTKGDIESVNEDMIIAATHSGDELCIDLLNEIGTELGKALSIAVHLFNPELILVDGLLAKADKFITIPIEQAINKYCLSEFKTKLSVNTSHLDESAGFLGTFSFVLERLFEEV